MVGRPGAEQLLTSCQQGRRERDRERRERPRIQPSGSHSQGSTSNQASLLTATQLLSYQVTPLMSIMPMITPSSKHRSLVGDLNRNAGLSREARTTAPGPGLGRGCPILLEFLSCPCRTEFTVGMQSFHALLLEFPWLGGRYRQCLPENNQLHIHQGCGVVSMEGSHCSSPLLFPGPEEARALVHPQLSPLSLPPGFHA